VRDRLSFTRFLGLGIEDGIPDGTTLWLFRETLAKAGLIEKLFEGFGSIWRRRATLRVAVLPPPGRPGMRRPSRYASQYL
jgi:IS5 family transposase